ncbi:uncharacterized protein CELE_Y51B9A.14 [Caenorhabditis elegans]|uniref:Uncharacterized protein n=1 Tax=Caenorhabditis elegans TaxID=6239 RepID=F9UKU4_CAEEL|nr:Uncharacterized protein CELE_Y51B9A.14 [Caenorhabditis elegans]CCC42208.1 Uncharacterized protein CELE_Y51B9A.14 [Caenorhabditis elegans]|eukprot:NP_001254209.1 Uncharacterized protein CELE_Y51B9A.14 [Caenorhabditis elegans]
MDPVRMGTLKFQADTAVLLIKQLSLREFVKIHSWVAQRLNRIARLLVFSYHQCIVCALKPADSARHVIFDPFLIVTDNSFH